MPVILRATTGTSGDANWQDSNLAFSSSYAQSAQGNVVNNTNVETALPLATYTIPANTLEAGSVLRFFAQGIVTSVAAADTLRIRLRFGQAPVTGGAELLDTLAFVALANDIYVFQGEITMRDLVGNYVAAGMVGFGPAPSAMSAQFEPTNVAPPTGELVIGVTVTWSAVDAGNRVRSDIFNIQILSPP